MVSFKDYTAEIRPVAFGVVLPVILGGLAVIMFGLVVEDLFERSVQYIRIPGLPIAFPVGERRTILDVAVLEPFAVTMSFLFFLLHTLDYLLFDRIH